MGIPQGQLSPHSVVDICDLVGSDVAVCDYFVQHLNALPPVYASEHGHLALDESVLRLCTCHPLFFQTFKPVQTTGDGSCLYHALSLTLTRTEMHMCTDLLRLLAIHALVKFKTTINDEYFPRCIPFCYRL